MKTDNPASYEQLGRLSKRLNSRMDTLEQAQSVASLATSVGIPVVDGGFAPVFTAGKKANKGKVRVTLRFASFGNADDIKIVMVYRDEILTSDDYNQKRFKGFLADKPNDNDIAAQQIVTQIDLDLLTEKTVDIVRMVAISSGVDRASNPQTDPAYSGYPGNVVYSFVTPAQAPTAGAPSKPTSGRLISNTVDPSSDGSLAVATLRIYADETQLKTFAEQGTVSVQPKVVDSGAAKAPAPPVSVETPTVTFIDDSIGGLLTGFLYTWTKNTAFDSDGLGTSSAAGTLDFIAGGFRDPSDGLANLTLVSTTTIATEDPSQLLVTFTLHQPSPAYKLKNYTAKRKKSASPDSDYDLDSNLVVDRGDLRDPTYSTAGDINITFLMNVRASKTYKVKILVRSIQGYTKEFVSSDISTQGTQLSAATTANTAGTSLINGGALIASRDDYNTAGVGGAAGETTFPGLLWQTGANSGTKINSLATGVGGATIDSVGLQWDKTNSRIKLNTDVFTKGGKPAVRIGKLLRAGDIVSLCPVWKATTADESQDITVAIVDQTGPTDIATATASAADLTISYTDDTNSIFLLMVGPSYTGTGKQWVEIRLSQNPAHALYVTNFQLHYGAQWGRFQACPDEQAAIDAAGGAGSSVSAVYDADTVVTDVEDREYNFGDVVAGKIQLS